MIFYFVQRGETLYAIARRYQTTVHALVAANRLADPNEIQPGQALIIPRPGEVPLPPPGGILHLVRPGETIFMLATKFGTPVQEIIKVNQVAHPEFILPGQQIVIPEPADAGEDWPMYGRTAGRSGTGPVVLQGQPEEGWTYVPRKQAGVKPSAPVVRYDRVYAGLGDGYFYCLDRHSGRVMWRIAAGKPASDGEGQPLAAPAIHDGLAYLCGPDGSVAAVDAYTGKPIWRITVSSPITSSPAVSQGVVYFGAWDGQVLAVEAKTGSIAWKRCLDTPVVHPVAVGDEQVFVVTEGGVLWALKAHTGETCWTAAVEADRSPVFADVLLLAGGRAYDPRDGQVLWEVEGPAPGLLAHVVTGNLVIGVGRDERLYAWGVQQSEGNWAGENPLWTRALRACSAQPPAVAQGQLILSMGDGSLCTYRFERGH